MKMAQNSLVIIACLLLLVSCSSLSGQKEITVNKQHDSLLVHMLSVLNKLGADVTNLKNELKENKIEMKRMESKLELKHSQDIHELKRISSNWHQVIGFHVALTKSQSTGGKVAFDKIVQDYGNGWNSITHTYIVPTRGLYFFSLTVMSSGDSVAYARLMRGSRIIQEGAWAGANFNVGTTSTVMKMRAGENVYAQYITGTLYSNNNKYTHLVGFLIQKMN